jgi:hypothetical protein
MRKLFILLLLFFASSVEGRQLLENLSQAEKGDYLVLLQGKNYTFLIVGQVDPGRVVLDEIVVPQYWRDRDKSSWRDWLSTGAPHHSAWLRHEISPSNGRFLSSYSLTKHLWLDTSKNDHYLTTLLTFQLNPISWEQRRRLGPVGVGEDPTRRELWQPTMIVDGKPIAKIAFSAWEGTWPGDGSPFAGKNFEVYLAPDKEGAPTYFPYWLRLTSGPPGSQIRVVDSGKKLTPAVYR